MSAKAISTANRPRARQRTSEVRKYLTVRTNRRAVTRSKATGCSLIHALASGGSQPPASEPSSPQPRSDVRRSARDVPDQFCAVVFDHERHRPLIDPEVIRCYPPAGRAVRHRIGLVKRRLEAVALRHAEVELGHGANRRNNDLRSERQGRQDNPRCQRAVVRAKWRPAGAVFVELSLGVIDHSLFPPRSIARRYPPAEFAVAYEFERVAPRVFLVNIGRLAAVLEVVAVVLPHKRVADATEINPEMRELMREERPGVEQLASIDFFPAICGAVSDVALGR